MFTDQSQITPVINVFQHGIIECFPANFSLYASVASVASKNLVRKIELLSVFKRIYEIIMGGFASELIPGGNWLCY